jgi:O-antigen ligase
VVTRVMRSKFKQRLVRETGELCPGGQGEAVLQGPFSRWLAIGLFWLPVGMAVMPGSHARSLYHWSLALTLFIPALWLLARNNGGVARRWVSWHPLQACLVLFAWAGITLIWATGKAPLERLKGPLFVLFFLSGWISWASGRSGEQVAVLLRRVALALALAALAAMIAFPWRDIIWHKRMIGLALLDGPNLSAYVMCCAFIWLAYLPAPTRWMGHGQRLAQLVLLVFIAWTGSRGAWVALAMCLVAMSLVRRSVRDRLFALVVVGGLIAALILVPSELTQRGLSYRPQIFRQALALIEGHPWGGLGLGTDYQIFVGNEALTHSHNLFTSVAIEIGLPGLLLWAGLWIWIGGQAWRHRGQAVANLLLATWIFASVALQVDGPSLLQSPRAEWFMTWLPLAQALWLYGSTAHRPGRRFPRSVSEASGGD